MRQRGESARVHVGALLTAPCARACTSPAAVPWKALGITDLLELARRAKPLADETTGKKTELNVEMKKTLEIEMKETTEKGGWGLKVGALAPSCVSCHPPSGKTHPPGDQLRVVTLLDRARGR